MSRNLTLVIHALHSGGAERVLARLANHWAASGMAVTVITFDSVDSDTLALRPEVRRIGLREMRRAHSRWQGLLNNLRRIWRLRQAIRRSGAQQVLSFTDKTNIVTLLACVGIRGEVLIAERSHPAHQQLSPGWERLRRWTYPRCRALVVQTAAVAEFCRQWVPAERIVVIPNAAFPASDDPRPVSSHAEPENSRDHRPRTILALGRLSREKGFDLAIRAFATIAAKHPDWTLTIAGEGDQRTALERLRDELGLPGRVVLPGWADQPASLLAAADLFVLPSRYEGFPNALLEAMASGLPAVACDCECGPSEIIRPEVDGLLVPCEDVAALAAALERLVSDPALRQRMGRQARDVVTRFSASVFLQRWDAVLATRPEATS